MGAPKSFIVSNTTKTVPVDPYCLGIASASGIVVAAGGHYGNLEGLHQWGPHITSSHYHIQYPKEAQV